MELGRETELHVVLRAESPRADTAAERRGGRDSAQSDERLALRPAQELGYVAHERVRRRRLDARAPRRRLVGEQRRELEAVARTAAARCVGGDAGGVEVSEEQDQGVGEALRQRERSEELRDATG